jgi:Glutathione S-transferase, N-terminal domain
MEAEHHGEPWYLVVNHLVHSMVACVAHCTHTVFLHAHCISVYSFEPLPNQLEEMGLPYKVEAIDIGTNKQKGAHSCRRTSYCAIAHPCFCKTKTASGPPPDARAEPWFLKICPNGRIPALIDHDEGDLNVWESGDMQYWQPEDVHLPN